MQGLMMDFPLLISSLIGHADQYHGDTEIVSRTIEGPIHRYNYREAHRRARQLANALRSLGVAMGDRCATLAWNGYRHFEVYYAVSGIGAVCHTINPRLFPAQIAYIINHAEDSYVFADLTFLPLIEALADQLKGIKGVVVMTDQAHMPDSKLGNLMCYETLIHGHSDTLEWPRFDENTASSLCYTSGTTGNPRGSLYSHRSTLLHTFAACMPDGINLSARDILLPVVPMFHVNAWGIPYSAAMVGCKLVLPGMGLDGASLHQQMEEERVTVAAGVPTIWLGLLNHLKEEGKRLDSVARVVVGGTAAPRSMIETFQDDYDIQVLHAWGMTEMSPLGTANVPKSGMENMTREERVTLQLKQGRPVYGVEMKITDDAGKELPRDGVSFGELKVRGPWICKAYFKEETSDAHDDEGWFATGDVATIDAAGYMEITDRSKDVIKSGGEWISSIALENTAMGIDGVAEAAVIGVKHPKWDERPLLIIVPREGSDLDRDKVLAFFEGKVAKWWLPDDVLFVDELPHTATGKVLKVKLREDYGNHKLPTA